MKKQFQPLTPAALYARVSSDRQDVDLSVAAQLRALRDHAKNNGYSVVSMTRNIRPVKGEIYRVFRPADLQGL